MTLKPLHVFFITSKNIASDYQLSERQARRLIKACKDAKNINNRKITNVEFFKYYDLEVFK